MTHRENHYVASFHKRFQGRIAISIGYSAEMVELFPIVIEDEQKRALGIVAMAAMSTAEGVSVHLYHFSAFQQRRGNGSKMLALLCKKADQLSVILTVDPTPSYNGKDLTISSRGLIGWYQKFGFRGETLLRRHPQKQAYLKVIK